MMGTIEYVKAAIQLGKRVKRNADSKKKKKKKTPGSVRRDYRGVDGAVDDAERG